MTMKKNIMTAMVAATACLNLSLRLNHGRIPG